MQLTKDYLEAREAAMTWLSHDAKRRDYDTGVDILIKSGFKPTVAKKLKSHGHQPWTVEKLHYCLREMIQMYYAPDDERFADVPDADILNHEDPSSLTSDKSKTLIEQVRDKKKFDEMPRVIQLLIRTFADSYKQRAILHRQMSDIPEDNSQENMDKRSQLSAQIDYLSEVMDKINVWKEAYDKGSSLPDADEMASILNPNTDESKKNKSTEEDDKIASMDENTLKIRHHSIQNQITRKENQIKYQSPSKKDKDNPMPECPKRLKLQKQIENLKVELEKVDYALARLA